MPVLFMYYRGSVTQLPIDSGTAGRPVLLTEQMRHTFLYQLQALCLYRAPRLPGFAVSYQSLSLNIHKPDGKGKQRSLGNVVLWMPSSGSYLKNAIQ